MQIQDVMKCTRGDKFIFIKCTFMDLFTEVTLELTEHYFPFHLG